MTLFGKVNAQLLIRNVNLVDVDHQKILQGYNVLVQGDHIISVDKRTYKLPAGTEVIDGTGRYLIPGLIDAHVHFFQSGGIYARPDAIDLRKTRPYSTEIKWSHDHMERFLRLYTSAGITSVMDVGASVNFLKQRDSFSTKTYAPDVIMTGPLLTTYIPVQYKDLGDDAPFVEMKTEEGTRQSVRDQVAQHADFIKIWYITLGDPRQSGPKSFPLVKAAIDEAHKLNKRVAVHATQQVTATLAVEAGADYLVHNIDDTIITQSFIDLLKKHKTVLCPTMVVAINYDRVLGDDYHFQPGELQITDPYTASTILEYPLPDTAIANRYIRSLAKPGPHAFQKKMDSILAVNLKKLLDAGITIATGTDAGNTGTQHVSSYFIELQAMRDAGFNNWQLLQSSTINAAKAAGLQDSLGSIAKGKRANMVLLTANPLDSLANWRMVDKVINKGVVFRPDSLQNWSAEELVQQQLNGYNAHDLDAFLDPYADDIQIDDLPGSTVLKGKEAMRKQYGFIQKVPTLHCRLVNRIVQGDFVIDHEEVAVAGKMINGVVIYQVLNGKIRHVWFTKD